MERKLIALGVAAFLAAPTAVLDAADTESPVANWLDGVAPATPTGVSWGVPWPRGAMAPEQEFALTTTDGRSLPVQTWPMAYWPDGTLKWSGFATVAGGESGTPVRIAKASGPGNEPDVRVSVREGDTVHVIDTGPLQARILGWGGAVIESLHIDGREVARDGELTCILQNGPDGEAWNAPARERYASKVEQVTIEQNGPVRAVVKLEGRHVGADSGRAWLPFVVRLYFYAGQTSVRMVHTIVYDGDEQTDFIRGLGLTFAVPMREEVQNRHVWFSGERDGLWGEPVQPLIGRSLFIAKPGTDTSVFPDQVAGLRVPDRAKLNEDEQSLLDDWAIWSDFKLSQPTADSFSVEKRTGAPSAWIPAGSGGRASGFVFAGDVSGGLGVSVKNFWQSKPTALEVRDAAEGVARVNVWLWSPDGPAMDMRHYDTRAHGLAAVYEDVQPGLSTPLGVARTSELMLYPRAGMPARDEAVQLAQAGAQPPLLVCAPEYFHEVGAFGVWSLPDRSTPFKQAIEDRMDAALDFYLRSVEDHDWYGFWDFGDVMHSYDAVRHQWRYDLGGMAWHNTELASDLWLWMSFLRSGRADVFRMAEAMTRHTQEVDVYHLGPLAGLGSRHNVRHWGCGAKEVRISMATMKRPMYYLTTDERLGDLMRDVVNVDYKTIDYDPMRIAQPITPAEQAYPARIRGGPDWLAFVANWMTEWERTGDTKWRDKIYAGMDSYEAMPYWFRTGKNLVSGYDPDTGRLYQVWDEIGDYNLTTIQGGAQVVLELNELIDHPGWQKAWLQYCRLGMAPADVVLRDKTTGNEGADASYIGENNTYGTPRLAAYAYWKTGNEAFGRAAVNDGLVPFTRMLETREVSGPETLTPRLEAREPGADTWSSLNNTNFAAQAGLSVMEILEMCADILPTEVP